MKLLTIILPRSKGSKMMNDIKELGGSYITCIYGMAIEDGEILSMLKMNKKRKEIVRALIEDGKGEDILSMVDFGFHKDDQSIAFTVDLDDQGGKEVDYQAIYVVVDRHQGDKVIKIAQDNGANGATVMHGRGAGVMKESIFMNMTIEPEKDIILMLVGKDRVEKIKKAIYEGMNFKDSSTGIIFTIPVSDVRGLVEQNQ